MIKAVFWEDGKNQRIGYQLSGHAGMGSEGTDIVCSAVSALCINTANALEGLLKIIPEEEEREGFLKVILPTGLSKEQQHDAKLLLDTLYLGLSSIQESYGSKVLQLSTIRI